MSHVDLLATTISDALTGKPVDLGFTAMPKLVGAIKALKSDPVGRVHVLEHAVRACMTDPLLAARLRQIVNAP